MAGGRIAACCGGLLCSACPQFLSSAWLADFVGFYLAHIGSVIDRLPGLQQSAAMMDKPQDKTARARQNLEKALLPILIFAPLVAVLCWTAAWIFRDEFIFKAALIGLGCFTIVVGAVACLLVLLKRIDHE